jgi:hypothetical protein
MKKVLNFTVWLALISIAPVLNAQEEEVKPGIGRGDLESQFNYMIFQSEQAENYRVIRSWWLYNVRNQMVDTLKAFHRNVDSLEQIIFASSQKIDTLSSTISGLESNLATVKDQRDNIQFIGMSLTKGAYKNMVWVIIGILSLLIVVFYVMYRRSNVVTSRSIANLEETKAEYEDYKKKALLREQQQMRRMYDEVLKYKNQMKQ